MPNNKNWGVGLGVAIAWELAGHWLAGGEKFHCASLVLCVLLFSFFFLSFLFLGGCGVLSWVLG